MSEFDEWMRRTRRLFDELEKMMEEMFRDMEIPTLSEREGKHKVYYYGFSVSVGPDGTPRIQEWGNIKPGYIKPKITETAEPFTDVMEDADKYRIVVDLPGVEKSDIKVKATERKITVSAERGERKYFKEIHLQKPVKPETAKATYKNGVLTIEVEKKEKEKKDEGINIKIE